MKEIGRQPVIEVPVAPFGFLQMPEKADQTFQDAFKKELKQYSKESLAKIVDGHCKFDEKGLLHGSNPLVLTLLRQKDLLPNGEYLFSTQDFARAFNNNPEAFRNTYQDLGFAVTINPDQAKGKNILIKDLARNIKDLGYSASPENPIFVPHTSFNLQVAKNSPYGFKLKLENGEGLVEAPAYGVDNNIKKFDNYDENSIPIPTEGGANTIYSVPTSSGVFQVFSDDDQSAVAFYVRLSFSYRVGRVVVGSAVPQNYTKALEKIKQVKAEFTKKKQDLIQMVKDIKI